jgi:hypothetical protein
MKNIFVWLEVRERKMREWGEEKESVIVIMVWEIDRRLYL